ncbi:UDP-N-acetylmuramoyl-L-alanine--D-glutamate ligase [Candidatus Gracilibacteria bacterium]|nr:UDP-N-acetylmuramoyl-L-alanine--D-glutamate ligase [Candidatus Gracilibacteria bacterium]
MILKQLLDPQLKIAILGFGKEGQSSLKFLLEQGREDITILDLNKNSQAVLQGYQDKYPKIQYILGDGYLDTLEYFDIIIKTPGISPFQEKLLPHKEKCISQTHIFFSKYHGRVIGITGTKGKSTLSTLLTDILQELGYKVKLVGNIGNPVLEEVNIFGDLSYDFIIYELSSYMLQDFSPPLHIGLLNNIYPCHLDWHYNSFYIYKEAKLNILKNAQIQILNTELKNDREVVDIKGEKKYFGNKGRCYVEHEGVYMDGVLVLHLRDILLLGNHNLLNISAILETLLHIESDTKKLITSLKKVLKNFNGLPHRLQNIGNFEGIQFIDDAIATTPESTIAAIRALNPHLQSILLGGQDSGFDFTSLRREILTSNIDIIIAFPDTSEKIFPEITYRPYDIPFEMMIEGKNILFLKTRSMKIAVSFCYRNTLPGKTVLLSSGAPSFSLWKSYIHKAEEFILQVTNF